MINKLIRYLESHGVKVIASNDLALTVQSHGTQHGKPIMIVETIPATVQAVRNWLGY